MTNAKATLNVWDTVKKSVDQMKANSSLWVLLLVIYTIATVASLVLQGESIYTSKTHVPYADILLIIFSVPVIRYALAAAKNKNLDKDELFNVEPLTLLYLVVASLLFGLIVTVSLLALIIPAVFTIAWFIMYQFVLVDKKTGPIESLKQSKTLGQNNKALIWKFIGVSILLVIPAGILSAVPYIGASFMLVVSVLLVVIGANLYYALSQKKS